MSYKILKRMELPSIPVDSRKEAIKEFMKFTSFIKARQLESYCHVNRCREANFYDIPCWSYNGKLLFNTDKPTEHIRYAGFVYSSHVLRVLFNLQHTDSNTSVQDIWYSNDTNSHTFKQFQDNYYSMILNAKKVLSEKTDTTVGLFVCTKCNSKDIDTEQKQTRSADEPMTLFCACNRCGKRWVMK